MNSLFCKVYLQKKDCLKSVVLSLEYGLGLERKSAASKRPKTVVRTFEPQSPISPQRRTAVDVSDCAASTENGRGVTKARNKT